MFFFCIMTLMTTSFPSPKFQNPETHRNTSPAPTSLYLPAKTPRIGIEKSANCLADRLEISGAGHPDLSDAKRFCGIGSFVSESKTNKLVIGKLEHSLHQRKSDTVDEHPIGTLSI